MKLTIPTKPLLNAAAFAASVVKTRTTMPALQCIKLTATEGKLECFGSDLKIFKTKGREAQVSEPGSVGVPAKLFVDWLRTAPSVVVGLELKKDFLIATAGDVEASFATILPEEFPAVPSVKGGTGPIAIAADELQKKLKRVAHAAHTDPVGFAERCGVWAEFKPHGLVLACFDGKRLATDQIQARGDGAYIIPTDLVHEVCAVEDAGTVMMSFTERQAVFTGDDWGIQGSLVDGSIPDVHGQIPIYQQFTTINREALTHALRRMLLFTVGHLNNGTKAEFNGKTLTLSIRNHNGCTQSIPATGPKLSLVFNPDHLLAALSFMEAEEVNIGLIDKLSPIQIAEGDFVTLTSPYIS
jgi:DNA polymerase III subunit beta